MTTPSLQYEALNSANDAVYVLESDRFVFVNHRFVELFGYPHDEVCGPGFDPWRLIHPEDRPALETRRRLAETGAPLPGRYEFRAVSKDGRSVQLEASVGYVREGSFVVVGILKEISARKAYERRLLRSNHELAVMNVVAEAITEVHDLPRILENVVDRLIEVLGVDAAGVSLLGESTETFAFTHYRGTSETFVRAMRQSKPDDGILGIVLGTRGIQIVEDVEQDARIEHGASAQEGFRSVVAVPLTASERILGVVSVFSRMPKRFVREDIDLFVRIARRIAVAVENARLYQTAAEGVARLQALSEITRGISSTLDVEGVFQIVGDRLQPLIDYTAVDLLILDEVEGCFRVRRVERPPAGRAPVVRLLEPRPVDADPALTVALEAHEAVVRPIEGPPSGHEAVVPIIADRQPVGLFVVTAQAEPRARDRQLLTDLAAHLAISLRNARTFSALDRAYRELKDAKDQLVRAEKLQALGEMAAGVAHDFNNVLSAILGRAQMLEVMLKDPNHLRSVQIIAKAALDGAGTVRRIQAFAKEKPESPLRAVPLNPIIRETLERAHPLVAAPNRPVDVVMDLGEVPPVLGDALELREALTNLIHNALDAMPHGGRLVIRTGFEAGPWFEVEDNGVGMDAETANRIFDPFFTTKGDQGSGLGLSVTYAIIQRHLGRFEVDSKRNEGTRVRVYLKEARASGDWSAVPAAATTPPDGDEVPPSGARVLLVEDDVAVREVLADILRTGAHQVVAAANGAEGLRCFAQSEFDMVLTDLGMPGMDGWEVARTIKAERPDVPVGLITGWSNELDETTLRERGIDVVVPKPVRMNQVLEAVAHALDGRAR